MPAPALGARARLARSGLGARARSGNLSRPSDLRRLHPHSRRLRPLPARLGTAAPDPAVAGAGKMARGAARARKRLGARFAAAGSRGAGLQRAVRCDRRCCFGHPRGCSAAASGRAVRRSGAGKDRARASEAGAAATRSRAQLCAAGCAAGAAPASARAQGTAGDAVGGGTRVRAGLAADRSTRATSVATAIRASPCLVRAGRHAVQRDWRSQARTTESAGGLLLGNPRLLGNVQYLLTDRLARRAPIGLGVRRRADAGEWEQVSPIAHRTRRALLAGGPKLALARLLWRRAWYRPVRREVPGDR